MFPQTTVTVMIILESAGLAISIAFGIAAFKAWRLAKKQLAESVTKFEAIKAEFKKFTDALSNI